jgi:hypothetical protein
VESRKAWRNRDASAGKEVLALLEALRDALGARAVGLFDDDRGDPSGQLPPNFWDAFDERPCAEIDWGHWYRELRRSERVETTCGCGGVHHLYGFLIHARWALLLVAPPALPSSAASAISSSVRALAARLPPARQGGQTPLAPDAGRSEGESPGAQVGGLLWWVRKAPH